MTIIWRNKDYLFPVAKFTRFRNGNLTATFCNHCHFIAHQIIQLAWRQLHIWILIRQKVPKSCFLTWDRFRRIISPICIKSVLASSFQPYCFRGGNDRTIEQRRVVHGSQQKLTCDLFRQGVRILERRWQMIAAALHWKNKRFTIKQVSVKVSHSATPVFRNKSDVTEEYCFINTVLCANILLLCEWDKF